MDAERPEPPPATERLELVKGDGKLEVSVPVPIDSLDAAFEVIAALGWIN